MPPGPVQLSYESLNADCSAPRPGKRGSRDDLDLAGLQACLEAFVAIPSVDLVDAEARVRIRYQHFHIAVSRSSGTLYYTLMPEAANTPVATDPAGVIAFLTGTDVPESAPAPIEAAEEFAAPPRHGFHLPVGAQISLLVVLLAVLAGLSYHAFVPAPPTGYAFIADGDQLKALAAQYDGDYGGGTEDGLSFRITGSKAQIFFQGETGAAPEMVREFSARYARRDGRMALIGPHSTVIEFNPDGTLLYGAQSYPRIARR